MPGVVKDKYADVGNFQLVCTIKKDKREKSQKGLSETDEVVYEGRQLPSLDLFLE